MANAGGCGGPAALAFGKSGFDKAPEKALTIGRPAKPRGLSGRFTPECLVMAKVSE